MLRLKTRRFVFWLMVVCYFVTATAILLFANGYRLRFAPLRFAQTGNILATFTPTNANVYVDEVLITNSSPARIRALFPGSHHIEISKDGFISYKRDIHIEPRTTAFVNDIYLPTSGPAKLLGTAATSTAARFIVQTFLASDPVTVAGHVVSVTTTAARGTQLIIDGTLASRDLGVGSWRVAGGDANMLALFHSVTHDLVLRRWDSIDTPIVSISGDTIVPYIYKGTTTLFAFSKFEVWQINTATGGAALVTRQSKPIVTVLPLTPLNVVAVVFADQIVAYELSEPQATPIELVSASGISAAFVSDDQTALIYTTENTSSTFQYSRTYR